MFALAYWAEIFCSFLEELEKPKYPFEINGPLEAGAFMKHGTF